MHDKLNQIFDKQTFLIVRFEDIEAKNSCLELPWILKSLQDRQGQMKLRRLAWQITEEICEAVEERLILQEWDSTKFKTEIADAFHFLVELVIISNVSAEEMFYGGGDLGPHPGTDKLEQMFEDEGRVLQMRRWHLSEENAWYEVIISLARTVHQLNNRPWRTDNRPVDRERYIEGLYETSRAFVRACVMSRITADDLHTTYFEKAAVNAERIAATSV